MLSEKQAIEYLEYMKKRLDFNKIGYVYGKESIETALNLIKQQERKIYDYDEIIARLEEENTRKNKMIDLIAEKLAKTYHYTPKKCSLKDKEDIDCNNYKDCTDCAKQYFERKVRE